MTLTRRGFLGALSASAAALLVPRKTFFIGSMWRSRFVYECHPQTWAALNPKEREDVKLAVCDWLLRNNKHSPVIYVPLRAQAPRVEWYDATSTLLDPSRERFVSVPMFRKEIRQP